MNAYMQQYKQNSIETASPEQILLMLYDGAIRFTRQAIAASEQQDQMTKLGRISKVFAIIVEFSNTLNHDIGGEIAADLDGLYQFMLRELSNARTETDEKSLHVVEGLLVDLRTTWGEAILKNKVETKQQQAGSQAGLKKTVAVAG
jgi:flagellar protein FliS